MTITRTHKDSHWFVSMLLVSFVFGQTARSLRLSGTVPSNKLPDTGQTIDYTPLAGEDSDYLINAPSYTNKNDGTILDNITGLLWQQGMAVN